jgi:hypothetical protein
MRVGLRKGQLEPRKKRYGSLTAEKATNRIETLRHVYEEGYIPRETFESMKRTIEARVASR